MNSKQYFIGIDGGGSKCRATLYSPDNKQLSTGCAGSANIARDAKGAIASIIEASTIAVESAGLSVEHLHNIVAGAGLAGTGVSSSNHILENWSSPFKQFFFTSDLHTACLGSHQGNDGAVLIVGTGSCAAKMVDNQLTQYGGHGFVLGDKGSGAWMGKQAIQRSLEQIDGIGEAGKFARCIMDSLGAVTTSQVIETMNFAKPKKFAELAPIIMELAEQQDEDALAIIKEGTEYLSYLCHRVLAHNDLNLALVGGLADRLYPYIDSSIHPFITATKNPPEWGAVYFAKQQLTLAVA